jgi:hypothetical protein
MFTRIVLGTLAIIFVAVVNSFASFGSKDLWREVRPESLVKGPQKNAPRPRQFRTFALDVDGMRSALARAPKEFAQDPVDSVITLPMPDGSLQRFRVYHSLIVEPGLLEKFPALGETFSGQGIDDPTATVRFDLLPKGFHAMVLSRYGTVMIDPFADGDIQHYIVYEKSQYPRLNNFFCEVGSSRDKLDFDINIDESAYLPTFSPEMISGTELRQYRLALAGTWEYCNVAGSNTVAGCLAAMVTIMNRVNGVYERDMAIRMNLVANNNLIAFAGDNTGCPVGTGGSPCTSSNDPYSNNSGTTMLGQNQSTIDTVIGSANYDIGHVFSTGGGGVANLNGPCNATLKARGVTGLPSPFGDPFAIDYVAHEMGHQWGSNHTFNATTGGCNGNRSSSNAFEPGSGITIMGYAGLCDSQDLGFNSIDTFHARSVEVIINYSQFGAGNSCAQVSSTGNTPPSVTIPAGTIFNIPKQTPFSLTASATDANGDTLTYDWQQYNAGGPSGAATTAPNSDADGVPRPLFRNYLPTTNPTRHFPSLTYIRNNANVPPTFTSGLLTGELLPAITRTMVFRVLVRDNRAGGGGIATTSVSVNVDGASGPFSVTSPNTAVTYSGNSSQTITWNVAGTSGAPVNAANVRILFSADGGLTFPTVILNSTPNDGSETVTIPNVNTTQGRIRVEAVDNIFWDMSDVNFTVNAVATSGTISGQVFAASGAALRNAVVTLSNSGGVIQRVTTSSFGFYQFDAVPPGPYTVSVSSRLFRFDPQNINLTGNITGLNFTGQE